MDHLFRRGRRPRGDGSGDWEWFGYRVVLEGLLGQQKEGRVDAAGRLELARGVLAVTVHRRRLDAEATGDLFGVHVCVDEAKALALAPGQSIATARHFQRPPARSNLTTSGPSPEWGILQALTVDARRGLLAEKG
jgi:hypothetical protein